MARNKHGISPDAGPATMVEAGFPVEHADSNTIRFDQAAREPVAGLGVWYWPLAAVNSSEAAAKPCHAVIASVDERTGRCHLAILSPTGLWNAMVGVRHSVVPEFNTWTYKD
jgi:hypothetical protein